MERKLTILYGSQTGTAQDLAEQLWRESKRYYFTGTVKPMDDYNVANLLTEYLAVFVCSTTGQGTEPDNMKRFWKFLLRKTLPNDSLIGLKYAVLGLGDSSYAQFNYVAKRLNRRLEQLGARRIIDIGLCDDQHDLGPSAVYMNWIDNLWKELLIIKPLLNGLKPLFETPRPFKWKISTVDKKNHKDPVDMFQNYQDLIFSEPFEATVVSNIRTTSSNHFQDVRLISFEVNVNWFPGDVLMVRPRNSDENVRQLLEIFTEYGLPVRPEQIVEINEIDSEMPVPDYLQRPLSLKTIAKQFWDLQAIPRPRTFEILSINCTDGLEREKLIEFSSSLGQEDLYSYANRPRRTILEVLHDFPHATSTLTIDQLFELFQPIKFRSFSIASNPSMGSLDLLVAVVKYQTILMKPRLGLCSNWLRSLNVSDRIRCVIKKGTFKFPIGHPIVMVGPGTGLAPFRSFIFNKSTDKKSDLTLFFGCRGELLDFHCKNELEGAAKTGQLRLITAFSRDQDVKIYVQHRIKENSNLLKEILIKNNGWIFVAGSSKNMPQNVKDTFKEAIDDSDWIDRMIRNGRYQEETWA